MEGASTPATARVSKIVEATRAAWGNSPPVEVVSGLDDPRLPNEVRDAEKGAQSRGADGAPAGVYFKPTGTVYLLADQLGSDADVVSVLAHEALGHHGLRGAFGKRLGDILDALARERPDEVAALAEEYGLNPKKEADRRVAAEEVLARLAETQPQLSFVRRAVSAIKAMLRGLGLKIEMSDDDIVREFVIPARQFVLRRAKPSDFADTEPAFRPIYRG